MLPVAASKLSLFLLSFNSAKWQGAGTTNIHIFEKNNVAEDDMGAEWLWLSRAAVSSSPKRRRTRRSLKWESGVMMSGHPSDSDSKISCIYGFPKKNSISDSWHVERSQLSAGRNFLNLSIRAAATLRFTIKFALT